MQETVHEAPAAGGIAGTIAQLDRLLRGEATRMSALGRGRIELPESGLTLVIFALGLLYGGCMGTFALLNRPTANALLQFVSSMAKVPCLFFLTLVVTFPSLYVFNALVGSRLSLASVWRLMIAMLAVMMAILASLGPIVAFFSLSTNNYGFMLMLNVAVFSLAGFLGLKFLLHTLHRLSTVLNEPSTPANAPAQQPQGLGPPQQQQLQRAGSTPGALDRMSDRMLGSDVKTVFYLWILVFGLVGTQMSWVLRPFIGNPQTQEFVLFSARESNFYAAVWGAVSRMIGG
jgi:hypothetical protein